ncbi:hypothetical protein BZA77DRAFT_51846 [Pyronema omphalodes]|nr:hypothetical protein BZA77DRAFT_51846 [Pyronema omphalodes]
MSRPPKACHLYRQGFCRFGDSCIFSHEIIQSPSVAPTVAGPSSDALSHGVNDGSNTVKHTQRRPNPHRNGRKNPQAQNTNNAPSSAASTDNGERITAARRAPKNARNLTAANLAIHISNVTPNPIPQQPKHMPGNDNKATKNPRRPKKNPGRKENPEEQLVPKSIEPKERGSAQQGPANSNHQKKGAGRGNKKPENNASSRKGQAQNPQKLHQVATPAAKSPTVRIEEEVERLLNTAVPEKEREENDKPQEFGPICVQSERFMGNGRIVTYGPGFAVKSIILSYDASPTIILEGLPVANTRQHIRQIFEPLWQTFEEGQQDFTIHQITKGNKQQATVHFQTVRIATAVLEWLNTRQDIHAFKHQFLRPVHYSEYTAQIELHWYLPSRAARVWFVSSEQMTAALNKARSGEGIFGNRRTKPLPQTPRPRAPTQYALLYVGLDHDCTEEELRASIGDMHSLAWQPAKTTASGEDIINYVRSLFDGITLKEFKVLSKAKDPKQRAIVEFYTTNVAEEVYERLIKDKHDFLGGPGTLKIEAVNYMATFRIPQDIWKVLKTDIQDLEEDMKKLGENRAKLGRITESAAQFIHVRVVGKDRHNVFLLRNSIQKLLYGETTFQEYGKRLWNSKISHDSGRVLHNIQAIANAVIHHDPWNQFTTIFCSPQNLERAKQSLKNQYDLLLNQSNDIPVNYNNLSLPRIAAVIAHYGSDKASYDPERQILKVSCSPAELSKVRQLLGDPSKARPKRLDKGKQNAIIDVDCLICLETAETPVKDSCGHMYCTECLQNYFNSTLDTRRFPISCIGENCNAPFSFEFIHSLLSQADIDKILRTACDVYVQQNPDKYRYCPIADCGSVYATPNANETTGNVFNCQNCFSTLCTACNTEAHKNQTCLEYQISINPELDQQMFERWKGGANVKNCPREGCLATIEKNEGCEHMHCVLCNTHFCWMCLWIGASGNAVYEHVSTCVPDVRDAGRVEVEEVREFPERQFEFIPLHGRVGWPQLLVQERENMERINRQRAERDRILDQERENMARINRQRAERERILNQEREERETRERNLRRFVDQYERERVLREQRQQRERAQAQEQGFCTVM